jgi:hypothetical protein
MEEDKIIPKRKPQRKKRCDFFIRESILNRPEIRCPSHPEKNLK